MSFFNLLKYAKKGEFGHITRKRIKDRGISWKEHYHEKSGPLKKRFDEQIGEGSYYRWEGHDYTTNSDYFIVVGPSLVTKEGRKAFFAGIKKLPPKHERKKVYAPSGKYFNSILAALSYASNQWGAPFPKNQNNYSVEDLQNIKIPRKLKG